MGILSCHKLAELLKGSTQLVPALLPAGVIGALALGPGLIILHLYSEPTAEPAARSVLSMDQDVANYTAS